MEWLAKNWFWVAGVLLILVLILIPKNRRGSSNSGHSSGVTQREGAAMVAALVDAFEKIVGDTIGSRYSHQDRKKIALGMVAVMASRGISLDKITSDTTLFALVMAESVEVLTRAGKISRY